MKLKEAPAAEDIQWATRQRAIHETQHIKKFNITMSTCIYDCQRAINIIMWRPK